MSNILHEIVERKRNELPKSMGEISFKDLESLRGYEKERRDFKTSISGKQQVSVIAEVKKASPSKGIIRKDFDAPGIAEAYQQGGASAISVLTDAPFFKGDLRYLDEISQRVSVPLLRKDFIFDPYQVKEARAYGADAILLIATITEGKQLAELLHAANELDLYTLVECYSEADVEKVDFDQVEIFGVNNRDLANFEVDVHRGINLLKRAPEGTVLVSESGLSSPADLQYLRENGIHAALIGEFLMRQDDPGKALQKLLSDSLGKENKTTA